MLGCFACNFVTANFYYQKHKDVLEISIIVIWCVVRRLLASDKLAWENMRDKSCAAAGRV